MPKTIEKKITKNAQKKIDRRAAPRTLSPDASAVALCVIFRNNEDTIDTLLASVLGVFDEYVFTDTGCTDGTRQRVEAFLQRAADRGARTVLNNFVWCDDFSAARQCSFDAATARWRMFLDTDDKLVIERPTAIRDLVTKLDRGHPEVKGIFVPYNYAQFKSGENAEDESLLTMRLAKYDTAPGEATWRWADKVHERLERPGLGGGSFGTANEKQFRVEHKNKTAAEKKAAVERNAIIAEREYAATSDPKYKARLSRTIAMRMKGDNRLDEAIPYLAEVQAGYEHYPEGKQAAADLSNIFIAKAYRERPEGVSEPVAEHLETALRWAKLAGPSYECVVYHAAHRWEDCIRAMWRGQAIPQQTTHEGRVIEKGAQYVAAAQATLALDRPRAADVAEHLLEQIEPKLRLHPGIFPHAMNVRAAIDRITILVPVTPQPFDENGGAGMLGGSEEAVMYLAKALARLGRKVRVYCSLPAHRLPGPDADGIDWQPSHTFNADGEHGCLVLWRVLQMADAMISGMRKRGYAYPALTSSFLWLHDGNLGAPPEVVAGLTGAFDGTVVLSDFHKALVEQQGGKNLVSLSNGVVADDFAADIGMWDKDQMSVIYSSCPSRGLLHLLDMWPRVKQKVPGARLDIYYDWTMLSQTQPELYATCVDRVRELAPLDVKHHGGVDHATLNAAMKKCNVWAYSHFDNVLVETFCISAVKASACGATVLTTPNGAIPEVAPMGVFLPDPASYEEALVAFLQEPMGMEYRIEAARQALERFSWEAVARRFSDVWTITRHKKQEDAKLPLGRASDATGTVGPAPEAAPAP